mgnify:CR=1 FL=1
MLQIDIHNPTQLALAISLLALLLLWISSPLEIRVTQSELTTGNFKISRNYIKKVTPLDKSQMQLIRGVENDPAAHLEVRFWVHTGVMIEISDIRLKGGPGNTLAIVRWKASCTLLNGEPYTNYGAHFITIKWGKAVKFDVYEDTKTVSHGLDVQYEAGIKEAKAPKIES